MLKSKSSLTDFDEKKYDKKLEKFAEGWVSFGYRYLRFEFTLAAS